MVEEKARMMSMDIVQENIRKIRELFPSAVTEIKDENGYIKLAIDFEVLKQELSDSILNSKQERYQMTWPDKKQSIILSNAKTTDTLRPLIEKSVNFEKTENIYIESDNLPALQIIRENYLHQIKVICIDPPYNTDGVLLYRDIFKDTLGLFDEINGPRDENGNRLYVSKESEGKYHTNWINQIYPLLRISRDLLTEDGTIFIHIDDRECSNLLKICNEVFGIERFVTCIPRLTKPQRSGQEKFMDVSHDYIAVYSFNSDFYHIIERDIDPSKINVDKNGHYIKGDTKAILAAKSQGYSKGGDYDFEFNGKVYSPVDKNGVRNRWLWTKPRMEAAAKLGILVETGNTLRMQMYLDKKFDDQTNTLVDKDERLILHTSDFMTNSIYSNPQGFSDLNELLGEYTPSNMYPKPVALIKKLISLCSAGDDYILDFYSGSGTTGQAVLELNKDDGHNRKFILIQLPEKPNDSKIAEKFPSICDMAEERLKQYFQKNKGSENEERGLGFRVLKLDSSNMNNIYYNPSGLTQNLLEQTIDNVKPDRTGLDLLFQVMLECGALLSSKIEEKTINGKTVYCVSDNFLIACYDDDLDEETIKEIAKMQPIYASFKDSSFHNDAANINAEQIFKTYSPNTEKIKVI